MEVGRDVTVVCMPQESSIETSLLPWGVGTSAAATLQSCLPFQVILQVHSPRRKPVAWLDAAPWWPRAESWPLPHSNFPQ